MQPDLTAIHEAGHAIVGCGLHMNLVEVRLLDAGRLAGVTRHTEIGLGNTLTPFARMPYALAGWAAQLVICGDENDLGDILDVEDEDSDDLHVALHAARAVYGTERRAWRALVLAWERVCKWQRLPNVAAAIRELGARLEQEETVSDIYGIADRHRCVIRDRRLLPARRPFFLGEMRRAA